MAQFDLCPKCGAVARDGECSSCGYKIPGIYGKVNASQTVVSRPDVSQTTENVQNDNQTQQYPYSYQQTTWAQDASGKWVQVVANDQNVKMNNNISTVGIKVAVTVLIATLVIIVLTVFASARRTLINGESVGTKEEHTIQVNPGADYSGGFSEEDLYKYGSYDGNLRDILFENADFFAANDWIVMDEDPYDGTDLQAYEFDNYIDGSVFYKVEQDSWLYQNDGGKYNSPENNIYLPQGLTMYSNYFRLTNTGLANEDEINSLILETSMKLANMGEIAPYYAYNGEASLVVCDAYVTYMDEEVISFLYHFNGYNVSNDSEEDAYTSTMSQIISLNIDLRTGKTISAEETFDFGGDFYQTFKDKCLSQNGVGMDSYEDIELKSHLCNDLYVVWAYTPLGLEVGINRPGYSGWATVTFTDYSQFYKSY